MTREAPMDAAERTRALDPAASFLVQAPAGSGKTELLIQRFLGLLAHVDAPEEIVAITFTNKAAAEMRSRIMTALAGARDETPPSSGHRRTTWTLARGALARDSALGWRLEEHPSRLRVQTVDSFCACLTRQMPLLSRLGAQPETVDDPSPLYREAAARTLLQLEAGEQWSEDIAALLRHLDNDLPRVRDLLAAMLRQRDQWLRHVVGGVERGDLEGALSRLVASSLAGLRELLPGALGQELAVLAGLAAGHLAEAGKESPLRACAGITALPPADAGALPLWQGLAELLLTRSGGWRRRVDASVGFPAGKGPAADLKARMSALLASLEGQDILLHRFEEVRYLPPVRYAEAEWEIARALSSLLVLADAELRVVFSERNQVDFAGIAMAAVQALGSPGDPTELALHLDYRISHLLVDEFQDISINQYGLLETLTGGWTVGDGRTLFLVGDPMQSIYRFREAEVGKFLETWRLGRLGQVPLQTLGIRVNFRSGAGIVDWVNDVFSRVLPPRPDVARGAVDFASAVAFHGADAEPAVVVHPFVDGGEGAEAACVLDAIRAERARPDTGTIAILVRNRTHLAAIVPALQQAGLQFRAVDIEPLGSRPAIRDLDALCRALQHAADRVAWLAVLRAPWCGLTLADLARLLEDYPATVWDALQDETRLARLSGDGAERARQVCACFARAFDREGRVPVARNVEALWVELGGPATVSSATDLGNAQAYLALLHEHAVGPGLVDRPAFDEAVARLHAAPDVSADGKLQIMTMHRAKGLEFDVVILPGLGRAGRGGERDLLIWDERAREDGGQDLLLAPIRAVGAEEAPLYRCLQYFEKEREYYEEGRLLYVAATRARRRLHLLGNVRSRKDGSLSQPPARSALRQLWPVLRERFEAVSAPPAVPASAPVAPRTLRRLSVGHEPVAAPPPVPWSAPWPHEEDSTAPEFEWAGDTARHVGTVYHRAILQVATEGLAHWDRERVEKSLPLLRAALRQLGVPGAEQEESSRQVRDALVATLEDERGRWILAPEHTAVRNEYAISGIWRDRPVNAIIDRTFVDGDGIRWVVDYKTSRHEGGDRDVFLRRELERYAEPLSRYVALVRALHGGEVRAALYYPLLRGWIVS